MKNKIDSRAFMSDDSSSDDQGKDQRRGSERHHERHRDDTKDRRKETDKQADMNGFVHESRRLNIKQVRQPSPQALI